MKIAQLAALIHETVRTYRKHKQHLTFVLRPDTGGEDTWAGYLVPRPSGEAQLTGDISCQLIEQWLASSYLNAGDPKPPDGHRGHDTGTGYGVKIDGRMRILVSYNPSTDALTLIPVVRIMSANRAKHFAAEWRVPGLWATAHPNIVWVKANDYGDYRSFVNRCYGHRLTDLSDRTINPVA